MNDTLFAVLECLLGGLVAGALLVLIGAIRHATYWLPTGAQLLQRDEPPERFVMVPRTPMRTRPQLGRGEVRTGNCFLCGALPGACAHAR